MLHALIPIRARMFFVIVVVIAVVAIPVSVVVAIVGIIAGRIVAGKPVRMVLVMRARA